MAADFQTNPESAEAFHGRLAEEWESKYEKRSSFMARERILLSLLRRYCRKGTAWLDAGCGTGRFSRRLVELGAGRVVALDAAAPMLDVAGKLAREQGLEERIQFAPCSNLACLPAEEGQFDGILCSSVLEYLENPQAVLKEFARTLKPGGTLILSLPNRAAWLRKVQNGCFRVTRQFRSKPWPAYLSLVRNQYTRDEAVDLIQESGLTIADIQFGGSGFKLDPFPFWGPLMFVEAEKVDRKKPIILMSVRTYFPAFKAGGPAQSLHALVQRLSEAFDYKVITRDRDTGDNHTFSGVEPDVWTLNAKARVMYLKPESVNTPKLIRLINRTVHDLLYINSFFDPVFTLSLLFARKLGILVRRPMVLAPRGELAPGALALKTLRKRWYLAFAKSFSLFDGVWWQASSEGEKQEIITELALKGDDVNRVMVARDLAEFSGVQSGVSGRGAKRKGQLKAVFLSRISPMKNLDWALCRLGSVKGDVSFDVLGPISDQPYFEKCKKTAATVPQVNVSFLGAIPHEAVVERLSGYDLFVFPTLGENFGHVILESLLAGCPVAISTATPWQDLEREGAGWVVSLDQESHFEEVLQRVADMDEAEHAGWRDRAGQLGLRALHDEKAVSDNVELFTKVIRHA